MSGLLAPTKREIFLGYATIKQVFTIKLPEVRGRFAPEFTQYESDITRVVKEEVAKVHE